MDWLKDNPLIVGLAALALIVALGLRRGPQVLPLDWQTLGTFMRERKSLEVRVMDAEEKGPADFGVQFRDETGDSAKYFRSRRNGRRLETLDVLRRGQVGFTASFADEKLIEFARPATYRTSQPNLPDWKMTVLIALLRRIRSHANTTS
jgi:hypothetical protein